MNLKVCNKLNCFKRQILKKVHNAQFKAPFLRIIAVLIEKVKLAGQS